jgi:hypothetical protein
MRICKFAVIAAAAVCLAAPEPVAGQLAVDSLVRTFRLADGPSFEIGVQNMSQHATGVTVEFADWEVTAEGEHRFHPAGSRQGSCGDRLRAEPARLSLAGDAAAVVRLVHTGAEQGACRIMVWLRSDDLPLDDEEGVAFIIRTGVKAYIEP